MKEEMEAKWHKNDMPVVLEQGLSFSTWNKMVYQLNFAVKECRVERSHVSIEQTWDVQNRAIKRERVACRPGH